MLQLTSESGSSGHVRNATIYSLTGVRFVAAIVVVLFHFLRVPDPSALINRILSFGYLGVPFFFVLSGFVLAYNYVPGDAAHVTHGRLHDRKGFWVARFARIYPVYALALALEFPFLIHHLHEVMPNVGGHFASNLFVITIMTVLLIQAAAPLIEIERGFNTPAWSLSLEAFFYALFPLFGKLVAECGSTALIVLTVGSLAWLSGVPLLLVPLLPKHGSFLGMSGDYFWYHLPIFLLPMFFLGMVGSRLYLSLRDSHLIRRLAPSITVSLVLMLVISFACSFPVRLGREENVVATAFFSVLIFFLAFDTGPVSALLSNRPMLALGEASYAIYILQSPVAHYVQQIYTKVLHRGENFTSSLLLCVCVVAISLLINRFFEMPARSLLRKMLLRSR